MDRPADCPSILVLMEDRSFRREVVLGSKVRVAEELEDVAMEGIRAGLGHDVDDAAGEAAVLGVDVARKNAELGNRIEVRDNAGLLADRLLYAGAIQIVGVV